MRKQMKVALISIFMIAVIIFAVLVYNGNKEKEWYGLYDPNEKIELYCLYVTDENNYAEYNKYVEDELSEHKMYVRVLYVEDIGKNSMNLKTDNIPYIAIIKNEKIKKIIELDKIIECHENLYEYLDKEMNE